MQAYWNRFFNLLHWEVAIFLLWCTVSWSLDGQNNWFPGCSSVTSWDRVMKLDVLLMSHWCALLILRSKVVKKLNKACHVQAVYNSIDFSYRPTVDKKSCWEIQDGGKLSHSFRIFCRHGYILNIQETETTIFTPVIFTFKRERFDNELTLIISLILSQTITDFVINLWSLSFIHLLPMSQ